MFTSRSLPSRSSPLAVLLFSTVSLLPQLHVVHSCPLQLFSCAKPESLRKMTCGSHSVRCSNSSMELQFHGQGPWYPISNITYPDKMLVVRDESLTKKLQPRDCDFLYSFLLPISNFSVRDVEPRSLFDCKSNSYEFSFDFFRGSYGSSYCGGYDLYYSDRPEKLALKGDCAETGMAVVEWVLQFKEDGENVVDFSLISVGFSRHRKIDPQCFSCVMRGGECSSVDAAENSSCVCRRPCPDIKKSWTALKIGIGVGGTATTLALILMILCIVKAWTWRWGGSDQEVEAFLSSHGPLAVRRYTPSQVRRMTTSYSTKLGHGGYGTVYKGALPDGTLVAVKLLKDTEGTGEEFINEVASIGRTNHVNVVSLLGFCSERAKRALIYEFMPNGSLEKYLFADDLHPPTTASPLGWEKLHDIAVGIAKGLEYLHKGCNTRMVHFDIKPHNILLDKDFCPKISDFGLAKLHKDKDSRLSSMLPRGTIGYIAPEVFSRNFGVVSSKSDVYSYEMMVLEMVGRRRRKSTTCAEETSDLYFPHWIYEHLDKEDCGLRECGVAVGNEEIARKMVLVGLWCIQTNPSSRPSISKVVEMLEGSVDNLEIPPKPYLCSPERSNHTLQRDSLPTISGSL